MMASLSLESQQVTERPFTQAEDNSATETGLPLFLLHSLEVQNFRAIENATFNFKPGLNVIIGANNAAKTAVIDALRIVFGLGTFEKKEDLIRLRNTDISSNGAVQPGSQSITFTAAFYGKTHSDLPAQFYDMQCPHETVKLDSGEAEYTVFRLRYRVDFEYNKRKNRYEYARNDLKGGPHLANPVAHEALDYIRAIYLAPLRDLVHDRVRVGAEIERLVLSHTPSDKEAERRSIPDRLKDQAIELIKYVTDNKHHEVAGRNLAHYAKPYEISQGSLSFIPSGISDDLFRSMEPIFTDTLHGPGKLHLSSNGLGINQLIYASIVLSRRGNAEVDHDVPKFFLIEEPEAHLHPQLQDSFFDALNQITDHQLFVTSHSPTITAKSDLDKIIVMRRDAANRVASPLHLSEVFKGNDRADDKRYLHKFLDVTKSQLLFAKGAIFVEGITEAMLMQQFSEIMGRSLRDHAIEVVVVNSSHGFDHFRPLFDNGDDTYCRGVFITDSDENPHEVAADDALKADVNSSVDNGLETDGNTGTATGYGTFEFGLLRASIINGGNETMQNLLTTAMKAAAPEPVRKAERQSEFAKDFLDFDRPSLAYKKMKERTKETYLSKSDWYSTWSTNRYFLSAKSDFAFHLSEALRELGPDKAKECFIVPKYIRDAIEFVVGTQTSSKDHRDASNS